MFGKKPKRFLGLALIAAGLFAGFAPGQEKDAEFSVAEFKELKIVLDVKNQPWTTIPWKYSITEARQLAAKTKKPIFLNVNTGNCLGSV